MNIIGEGTVMDQFNNTQQQSQPQQAPQQQFGQQPPQYGQPMQYGQPPMAPVIQENPGRTLGIVSLVTGILGTLAACSFFGSFVGAPLGIAALTCGIIGSNRTPQGMSKGMAIAGIVLGGIAIVIGIVMAIFFIAALSDPLFWSEFERGLYGY
jgi:hypothetical protein